jgi:hypothetical protein
VNVAVISPKILLHGDFNAIYDGGATTHISLGQIRCCGENLDRGLETGYMGGLEARWGRDKEIRKEVCNGTHDTVTSLQSAKRRSLVGDLGNTEESDTRHAIIHCLFGLNLLKRYDYPTRTSEDILNDCTFGSQATTSGLAHF